MRIQGVSDIALLDSGATMSVVSQGLVKHLKQRDSGIQILPSRQAQATAANGAPIHFRGATEANVDFEGFDHPFTFAISEFCPYDVLLGMDFLYHYHWSLQPREETVSGPFGKRYFLDASSVAAILQYLGLVAPSKVAICMRMQCEIPPYTEATVPVLLAIYVRFENRRKRRVNSARVNGKRL